MQDIIEHGAVRRGWLGIEPQDLTPELARAFRLAPHAEGVIVAGVLRGGPADKSGLRVGDIVQRFDGRPVRDTMLLLRWIAAATPGQAVTLQVLRAGAQREIRVTMGLRPTRPR
ncbi:Periplasmic pH-dependent serine endoprotease DegQ precursor [Bordetella trematum]|nr:Periplasmic pH-dependent serine endoprotease DegQ precursor [Bordetella trematum]